MRFRPLLLLAATLLAAALTARLGLWQLDRANQKLSLQAETDARALMPELDSRLWPRDSVHVGAMQHRRARLAGHWLPEHAVLLDNRPMQGRTGFYLVMPLRLDDGSAVLVQRGWLPRDANERSRVVLPPAQPERVEVSGRLAPALPRLYEFEPAASGLIRQNLDVAAFAIEVSLPLRPGALIQDGPADNSNDDLIRLWPAPATGVDKHHGYAFQWFSLSFLILGLYVWFQVIRPRRRQR